MLKLFLLLPPRRKRSWLTDVCFFINTIVLCLPVTGGSGLGCTGASPVLLSIFEPATIDYIQMYSTKTNGMTH